MSGSLALELWALRDTYNGGHFSGVPLAHADVGRLEGQHSLQWLAYRLELATVGREYPARTLMLREWTASGYVTRDYRNFPAQEPTAVALPVAAFASAPVHVSLPQRRVPVSVEVPQTAASAVVSEPSRVSIQHATLQELSVVPGLNRKLAQEIIKARPFRALDELTRVRGIGEKTLRKLREVLSL
jgi:DNA uptake protein ComE-like DNA-binding protein